MTFSYKMQQNSQLKNEVDSHPLLNTQVFERHNELTQLVNAVLNVTRIEDCEVDAGLEKYDYKYLCVIKQSLESTSFFNTLSPAKGTNKISWL